MSESAVNEEARQIGDLSGRAAWLSYQDFRIRPHHCFACGELNEIGLHLALKFEPRRCHVELTIPDRFEGWEGLIHGGIVSTILDEVMAWALIEQDSWGVTARMSIQFHRPVLVGQAIRAEGWIVESKRRIQRTAGRIVETATGLELATAEATYVAAQRSAKARAQGPIRARDRALAMAVATARPVSATTVASQRFIAEHLARATGLGAGLAELVGDPDAVVAALRAGFEELGDPVVVAGERLIAPGIGPVLGVRLPLMTAVHREFKRGTRRISSSLILDIADRLLREDTREIRWFGMWNLGRLLPSDPERTWQLLRRAAAEADDWISVDTLAHPYAEGILRDGRRWAEIEQFVYSSWRWERRLVGSTLAALPHTHGIPGDPAERSAAIVTHGLPAIDQLIGDDEPDVQKALSWALRALAGLDPAAVTRFLEIEAEAATRTGDGHRAWVIRDSLSKLAPDDAQRLRADLADIRRRPGAPSTSHAAAAAAQLLQQLPIGTPSRAGDELRRNSAK